MHVNVLYIVMWENYRKGKIRVVEIPDTLKDAMDRFCEDHLCQLTDLLDISLRKFTILWDTYERLSSEHEKKLSDRFSNDIKVEDIDIFSKVGDLLINNPPPSKRTDDYAFHVRFSEEESFKVACKAERMAFVRSTQDFIKRVLSWYLRSTGYLK